MSAGSPDARTPLWTASEAAAATGGRSVGAWVARGVSIDTRSLKPGDLFVALKDVRDGHDFLDAAFAAGASAALVSRDVLAGRPGLVVDDVLSALERMGAAARDRSEAVRLAVTGSVGKTSVKEMLARIFRAAGPAHWSDKSFNNHWGVPLTLARMPAATRRAVFEIGMNTPGEIAPRSRMVRPRAAAITKIAPAHLEGVGSIEGVADEKADIFAGLLEGGAAVLPETDAFLPRLQAHALRLQPRAEVFLFGGERGARSATATGYDTDGRASWVDVDVMGEAVRVELAAVGGHWAVNTALALLLARLADVGAREAAEALSGYAPPPGRGVAETLRLPGGGEATLVDDAYNANPASMRAAIEGFARRPGRKVIALGEMRELGPGGAQMHAGLAEPVVASGASEVLLCGAEMVHLADALARDGAARAALKVEHLVSPEAAVERLKMSLAAGDAVLIKGSNASGMARVAAALRSWAPAAETAATPAGDAQMGDAQKAVGSGHAV